MESSLARIFYDTQVVAGETGLDDSAIGSQLCNRSLSSVSRTFASVRVQLRAECVSEASRVPEVRESRQKLPRNEVLEVPELRNRYELGTFARLQNCTAHGVIPEAARLPRGFDVPGSVSRNGRKVCSVSG